MPNLGVIGDQEGTNSKGDKIIVAIESGFTQSGARRWREFQNVVQLDDDSLLRSLSLSLRVWGQEEDDKSQVAEAR